MSKWIPDRKWWAGGVFMLAAFALTMALNRYAGADISMDEAFVLSLALGKAAEYMLPPSLLDIIKRLDDDLVEIAAASPESAVSREVGAAVAVALEPARRSARTDLVFDELMKQMRGEV